jgi:hypothetical protein
MNHSHEGAEGHFGRRVDAQALFLRPPQLSAQIEDAGFRRSALAVKGLVQVQLFT